VQAMTYQAYGAPDVLQPTTVARPVPEAGEVLVQVQAASLNQADLYLLRGEPLPLRLSAGLRRPKRPTLGADIAGRVVAVGSGVTSFQPGDAVYGDLSACGLGGFAEYVCAREEALAPKPAGISFAQAAAVPMAAVTALQGLRATGPVTAGERVLVHGASGGVGTFAVQLARVMGAHVTAVCSARNVEQARTLGAEHVIDYTREDFTQDSRRYDLILVANGRRSLAEYRRVLSPRGRLVVAGGDVGTIMRALLLGPALSLVHSITVHSLVARPSRDDLLFVGQLLDSGAVVPVIDRCYPLGELPEAMRYLASGHARGKVVITMEQAGQ
jgi:NADPH:quinone reductase-like Zn-dependent oxidoreductase